MTNRNRFALTASLAAALALPGAASAHDATAACLPDGTVVVTPDYTHLNPVVVIGTTSARVTWSDGYTRTIALPPCVAPPPQEPTPAPVPPVLEQEPPVVAPPPKEGGVKTPAKPPAPLVPSRSERVLRAIACKRIGGRGYSVVRITVTWKRAGKVVKTRTAVVRRAGRVCSVPAVTG